MQCSSKNIYNGIMFPLLNPTKIFSSIPDEQSQQKFGSWAESHAQFLIHQMGISALYCGHFEFRTFLWDFRKGRTLCCNFFWVHGEWIVAQKQNKSPKNHFNFNKNFILQSGTCEWELLPWIRPMTCSHGDGGAGGHCGAVLYICGLPYGSRYHHHQEMSQ